MAKVAIFLPDSSLIRMAVNAANELGLDLSGVFMSNRNNRQELLESALRNGTEIIIARGSQAKDIKSFTTVPIVEIKFTNYEIDNLLTKAKKLSSKPSPYLVLCGPKNWFSELHTVEFERRHHIRFRFIPFYEIDEILPSVQEAIKDGADVIIGGEYAGEYCQSVSFPFMPIFSSEESIYEACRITKLISDAIDQEKRQTASLNLLLDKTSCGIIHVNGQGTILRINQFVEHILNSESNDIVDLPVWRVIPGISEQMLHMVYSHNHGQYMTSVRINQSDFTISIMPISINDSTGGAIISFHESYLTDTLMNSRSQELIQQGNIARYTFETMIARSQALKKVVQRAKHLAKFNFPILISGPEGSERQFLAECIHNAGSYRDKPFIRFDCNIYSPEEADQLLFGNPDVPEKKGLLYDCSCTLYFHEIYALPSVALTKLVQYAHSLTHPSVKSSLMQNSPVVRIIVSSTKDLQKLSDTGEFRKDAYYTLCSISLSVPPLKDRPEDIMGWVDYRINHLQNMYGRYVKLTQDAQKYMTSYPWPDNLMELYSVCDRIFINCPKRLINSRDVQDNIDTHVHAEQFFLSTPEGNNRAELIRQILQKHHGNRSEAAKELGISTTTLWRQMNKYKIPKDEGKGN